MLFNSRDFALFFAIFFALYALAGRVRGRDQIRRYLIVIGSLFFYGYWYPPYLILLVICVLVNYVTIHALDRLPHKGAKAFWLITANCVFNLGILFLYKYTEFVVQTFHLQGLEHVTVQFLNHATLTLGIKGQFKSLDFALPLGVSFFTFEMMAYSIDVYRHGRIDPEARSLPRYTLFVTFFPKLIAGPIVRGWEILPQIDTPRYVTPEGVYWGILLFFWGLTKKVIISDRLAPFVNLVFTDPQGLHWVGQWLAVYCFAFQIYCDFSAYSDMAMGLCKMMGYELPLNFKEPYLSPNITVFWRRWHITLSSWLRDYLYIPLGGNRGGSGRQYRNLILTMLLGGLWHGANWVFVIWGLMHGLYLAVHKLFSTYIEHREVVELATAADRGDSAVPLVNPSLMDHVPTTAELTTPLPVKKRKAPLDPPMDPWNKISYWFWCIVTFHFVCLTWIFFRAGLYPATVGGLTPWQVSMRMLKAIFTFAGHGRGAKFWAQGYDVIPFLMLAAVLHVGERFVRHHRPHFALKIWDAFPAAIQAGAVTLVLASLLIWGGDQVQFIYFAF